MWRGYNDIYPHLKRTGDFYTGQFDGQEISSLMPNMTISEAILSPTRQWPIIIRKIMEKLIEKKALHMLHGISINTGGGATKIKHVGHGISYTKYMPKPAPIFQLIQSESKEKWENMYKTFNCGIGIDIVGEDSVLLGGVLENVAQQTGIGIHTIGICKKNPKSETENSVFLTTHHGNFEY
jgi:phosphoribosylaminoimidazole (AIR) synthetase